MSSLVPIEYKNHRIMTTRVLAEQFGTDDKVISNNFNRNIERFTEGKHFYKLEGEELREFKTNHLYDESSMLRINCLYLWTDRGAARHAKILETDEAWQIYEVLEETYFRVKESPYAGLSKELQAIFITDKKIQVIESRVEKLENTMTIDYSQQEALRLLINKSIINVLGGKTSPAYKLIGKKAFAELYRHIKRTFQVNSYKNIATIDFEEAKKAIVTWSPEKELELMIIGANTQYRTA